MVGLKGNGKSLISSSISKNIEREREREREREHFCQKDRKILELQKEIERWKKAFKNKRYGLVWIDIPEGFESDIENKLPILEEIPEKSIKSEDGKPTHILIEGDNYHALTCLSYTHKGKIDIIYIDPPYNTGSDGFKYKDKRFLEKFPNGDEVPKDHPFRRSYWLSFMRKRLELAKDLLTLEGVIFINIDDNEFAQLRLLCDEIFSDATNKGYVGTLIWQRAKGGGNSKKVVRGHEYILCYSRSDKLTLTQKGDKSVEHIKKWKQGKEKNKYVLKNGKLYFVNDDIIRRVFGKYEKGIERRCEYENLLKFKDEKAKKDVDEKLVSGEYILNKAKNGMHYICRLEEVASMRQVMYTILQGFLSEVGKNDLAELGMDMLFDYPKPVGLIKILLDTILNKKLVVLDFFAGSGTTGQAVLELNEEDGGSRQVILVTNDENKIMTDVCLPRMERVAKGYKTYKGLGNSIKYYRTAFIGENSILNANDKDKVQLTYYAGELLAIAENTLEQIEKNDYWQIFENEKQITTVYFREEYNRLKDFVEKVTSFKKKVVVYVFSWQEKIEMFDFQGKKNISLKAIPQPILKIYRQIHNLI